MFSYVVLCEILCKYFYIIKVILQCYDVSDQFKSIHTMLLKLVCDWWPRAICVEVSSSVSPPAVFKLLIILETCLITNATKSNPYLINTCFIWHILWNATEEIMLPCRTEQSWCEQRVGSQSINELFHMSWENIHKWHNLTKKKAPSGNRPFPAPTIEPEANFKAIGVTTRC